MYTLSLSLLAIMATPSLSTPLHPLYPRQFTNISTSTSSMTQTFTEITLLTASTFISASNTTVAAANATIPANATILAASASASATQAPCNATYSCTPGQSCTDVAGRYGITLSVYEADSACDSRDCKDIMHGYQLCYNGTADVSVAKATSSVAFAKAAANSTAAGTGTAPLTTGTSSVEIIKDTLRNSTTAAGTGTGAARVAATTSLPMFKDAVRNSTTAAAATGVASAKVNGNATAAATTTDDASAKVNGNATAMRVSTTTEVTTVTGASGNSTITVFRTITESAQAASGETTAPLAPANTTSSLMQDTLRNSTAAGTVNVAAETTSTILPTVPQETNSAGSPTNNAYAAPSTSDKPKTIVAAPPNGTHIIVATDLAELTVTLTATTTLTYMLGTGSAKAQRTALVTHTSTSVLTSSKKTAAPATTLAEVKETSLPKEDRIAGTGTASSKPLNSPTTPTATETLVKDDMPPSTLTTCATAFPPGPTQSGVVRGCAQWYVAQEGDWCSTIADTNGISVETFMANNPGAGTDCKNLWTGDAYCVRTCGDGMPEVVADEVAGKNGVQNAGEGITTSATSAGGANPTAENSAEPSDDSENSAEGSDNTASDASANVYETYRGDGSGPDGAGWPTKQDWTSDFDAMFAANEPTIGCVASWNVASNSEAETSAIRSGIVSIADETDVDARFILAVLMQESKGCVRAPTTDNGVKNPGLMQSHNGSGSCSDVAPGQCKESDIEQMVRDGVAGTADGDGLKALLQGQRDAGYEGAQAYYRAARAYNGGVSGLKDQLEDGCCTTCYASDIANRLTGWSSGASSCDL